MDPEAMPFLFFRYYRPQHDPRTQPGSDPCDAVRACFIGHSGGVSGYSATAFFQPDAEIGIIVLRNESALGMDKLVRVFAENLRMKPLPENQQPF
jgi:hypothetical protein